MSLQVHGSAGVPAALAATSLRDEHWLESATGFPPGSVGASPLEAGTTVVASARGHNLVRRQVDEALAFTEFLAGRAVPEKERIELERDIVDAFEDSPKQATGFLRGLTGGVRRIATLDPIERCQRRLQALTATYTIEERRVADDMDPSPVMAVVARHNPLIRCWPSTGIVLVADAVASRVELHGLVMALADRPAGDPAVLSQRLVDRTAGAGRLEIAELAVSQLRLLSTRAWLRDIGDGALERLRDEVRSAVASALDVDIVVQQVGYRAVMAQAQ